MWDSSLFFFTSFFLFALDTLLLFDFPPGLLHALAVVHDLRHEAHVERAALQELPRWRRLLFRIVSTIAVDLNGKRRGEIRAPAGLAETEVEKLVLADEAILRHLEGLKIRKVIVVKDRIVNIVVG